MALCTFSGSVPLQVSANNKCAQVQPNSISEQCGLKGADAILSINGVNTDELTHEQAKQEILRTSCSIDFLVERGGMKIWKPQVSLAQPVTIRDATGEEVQTMQKTSLSVGTPQESSRIGSSHNRAARPFGAPKQAVPTVVHAQYNTPIGLYSAGNIAQTYATQTAGIQSEMANLDLNYAAVGQKMTGTYQQLPGDQGGPGMTGIRSVSAPGARGPGQQRPQQQSIR